ncbi:MAG: adenylate kinase family protein [Natronomonas sp.]
MRVAITGTPGVGKTTATRLVETDLDVIDLNELVKEGLSTGTDEDRDSLVADLDAIETRFSDRDDAIFESHFAHHLDLDLDRVIVLRCHPEELKRRLLERGESERKATENAEAEALDVILSEAVDRHGLEAVYEIETTDRAPEAVARDIEAVLAGDRQPSAGAVDFTEYL